MLYNVSVSFQNNWIFKDLSFEPFTGKWSCILGKSGVGKSTLLRLLAGLPVDGKVSGDISKMSQDVSWMGQNDLLYPWKTVLENVLLSKYLLGKTTKEDKEKALYLLREVGLEHKKDVLPEKLSGGQRQRVALVRTLLFERDIVLMDEPFSALDAITKKQCQELFHKLLKGKTIIQISHDITESLSLCDDVYLMTGKSPYITVLAQLKTPAPRFQTEEVFEYSKMIWDIFEHENIVSG